MQINQNIISFTIEQTPAPNITLEQSGAPIILFQGSAPATDRLRFRGVYNPAEGLSYAVNDLVIQAEAFAIVKAPFTASQNFYGDFGGPGPLLFDDTYFEPPWVTQQQIEAIFLAKADRGLAFSIVPGSYTLQNSVADGVIRVVNTNTTITIPPASAGNFDTNFRCFLSRTGSGTLTLVCGSGVTINGSSSNRTISKTFGLSHLCRSGGGSGNNVWLLLEA
jgi:hypothetical protein